MSDRIGWAGRAGLVGCLFLLTLPATLLGQPMRATVGDTVRLDDVLRIGAAAPWLSRRQGIFAGRQADTVLLRQGDRMMRVRLTNLSKVRIQRGRKSWGAGKGIALGLIVSTVLQAVWVGTDSYQAAGCQRVSTWFGDGWNNCSRDLHSFHAYWFAAGAVGGWLLGREWKRPHWLKAILP